MLRLITEIIDTCLYLIKLCSVNIVTRFERERERESLIVFVIRVSFTFFKLPISLYFSKYLIDTPTIFKKIIGSAPSLLLFRNRL